MQTAYFNPRHPWRVATCRARLRCTATPANFNPRHPWRVATRISRFRSRSSTTFQSTPPVEGGDTPSSAARPRRRYFNPRHPWRVATSAAAACGAPQDHFNPRHPWRVATAVVSNLDTVGGISIHATRGGWRHSGAVTGGSSCPNFNPRHPWRVATRSQSTALTLPCEFQSTPPVEGGDWFRRALMTC